jgi:O-acetyl-ADP-ribose deacetylase (regulator of RNase III)
MLKRYLSFLFKRKGLFPDPDGQSLLELQESFEYYFDVAIRLERGSITKIRADAIVNSTNQFLHPGGGLDWSIHAAAGKELHNEIAKHAPCAVGGIVTSKGYNLPCTHVIHTVTPVWTNGFEAAADNLRLCYKNIFKQADKLGVSTIAIPAIGTGVHETPIDMSAMIAKEELQLFFHEYKGSIKEIIFVLHSSTDLNAYSKEFGQFDLVEPENIQINSISFNCEFRELHLSGDFAVNVVPSAIYKVTAFGKGINFDSLDTNLPGDVMKIESNHNERIVLNVANSEIDKIIFSGEGTLEFEDCLKDSLTVELNGDIDATIIGPIEHLSITAIGDGNVDARRSIAKNLSITQNGLYEIQAHATEHLKLVKEGFGDVVVTGSPKVIDSNDHGVGSVTIS